MCKYVWQFSEKCVAQIAAVLKWVGAYYPDFVDSKLSDLQDALWEYVIVHDDDTGEDMLMRACVWRNVEDMAEGPRTVYDLHNGEVSHVMW